MNFENLPTPVALSLALLLLIGVIVVGVWLVRGVRSDLKATRTARPEEILSDLEEAHRRGELDTAEFERVRQSVGRQLRSGAGTAMPPAPPPAASSEPPHVEPAQHDPEGGPTPDQASA